MKVSEALNIPLSRIMSMSKNELADVTRVLVRESNKRLTVLKKRNLKTPASVFIQKHGGRFKVKDRNLTQLRAEYQRASGFLQTKTSTVSGFRGWEKSIAETLKKSGEDIDYMSLSESQKRRFWEVYSKLEETDRANTIKGSGNYKTSVNAIYKAVKGSLKKKDIDAFVVNLNNELYAKQEKSFDSAFKAVGKYGQWYTDDNESPFK